jgi:beta-barrel assembly-enhancing protease
MRQYIARLRSTVVLGLVAGVTGTSVACTISPREEVQLGQQAAADINRQLPIVEDPAVHRYINLLGNQVAQHARRDFNYQFYVVNIDQVNAFAVPGGFIYINRGLFERTSNMSELAGVLAHEIAHVDLRHGAAQLERVQRANLGLTAAFVLLGRMPTGLEALAVDVAGAAVFARYSRQAEREADSEAIRLLVSSGINPNGLVTFFHTLMEDQRRRPSLVEQWFASHPLTEDRIAETRAMVQRLPPGQVAGLTTNTQEYESVKARLRQYPAPPPQFR